MIKSFSKREAIQFGWETTKNNLGFFISLLVVIILWQTAISVVENFVAKTNFFSKIVLYLIYFSASVLINIGLIKIALRFCDKEKGKISDLFSQYHLFFNYLFAWLIYSLIVFIGILLFIVPGIIWSIQFLFYPYFVVDKGLGPIQALKRSSILTKGIKWDLFVFSLMLLGINLLGALFLLVGLFVTLPVSWVALAFIYRKLLVQAEIVEANTDVNNDQRVS